MWKQQNKKISLWYCSNYLKDTYKKLSEPKINLNNNGNLFLHVRYGCRKYIEWKVHIYDSSIYIVSDLTLVKFSHSVILWWWVNPSGISFWRENSGGTIRVYQWGHLLHCLLGCWIIAFFPSSAKAYLSFLVCV